MRDLSKNIKRFNAVLMLLVVLSFICITSNANVYADSDSSQTLNNVEYNITVNKDGSMDVEEIWDISIEETNTLFKQFNIDKTKYTAITDGVVSTITNGTEHKLVDSKMYAYHVPVGKYYFLNRGSNYEVAWGTGLSNSSGTRKYVIRYHVVDAIAKYNDIAELYWQAFGSEFEIPIKKLTGKIVLPSQAENIEDIKVWGHTPDMNGEIHVTSKNEINFEINNNKSKRMIEVRVAMPSQMIESSGRTYQGNKLDSILEEETSWANEANTKRMVKLGAVFAVYALLAGGLIFIFIKNIIVIRNTTKLTPTQKFDYFRELPRKGASPLEARFILDNSYENMNPYCIGPVFMATVLSLSLKKAIKIENIVDDKGKEKDSEIEIITDNIDAITNNEDEKLVFNFIVTACKGENKITLKSLKKYIQSHNSQVVKLQSQFDRAVVKSLSDKKILDVMGKVKRKSLWFNKFLIGLLVFAFYTFVIFGWMVIDLILSLPMSGIATAVIVALIVIDLIIASVAKNKIDVYTQEGIDEQEKWKAFKKYMEDFSLLKEKDVPDLILWEQYLVYATAFGISEKVIKGLKAIYPEYNDSDFMSNYITMRLLMSTDFSKTFNSVGTTMSSSFSSGSGGGGGFSIGGGRRRRPAEAEEEDRYS